MHCVDAGLGHPIEDELHVCLECPAFSELRTAFANRIPFQDGMRAVMCCRNQKALAQVCAAAIKRLWHSSCTGCMLVPNRCMIRLSMTLCVMSVATLVMKPICSYAVGVVHVVFTCIATFPRFLAPRDCGRPGSVVAVPLHASMAIHSASQCPMPFWAVLIGLLAGRMNRPDACAERV